MWLKKLVGASMILALVGMNALIVAGVFFYKEPAVNNQVITDNGVSQTATITDPPKVEITLNPGEINAGGASAISWKTSGSPKSCTASGDWKGDKTQFGTESSGRISDQGTKTYILECKNDGGSTTAKATLTVNAANAAPSTASKPSSSTSQSTSTPTATFCGGRSPCYGPKDVAAHGSSGNCWGYNGDRVINITGLDAAYHKAKTGIGTIEVGGICGTNLAGSLNGSVPAGGQTHDHKSTTKANADRNEIPYFVGYYDANKK